MPGHATAGGGDFLCIPDTFQGRLPLRKISMESNRIGTKLNPATMGFRYQYSFPVCTYDPMKKN